MLFAGVGCEPGAGLLVVSLRSDLVAAIEVDELALEVDGVERARRPIAADEALLEGVLVAELGEVASGAHRVQVTVLHEGAPVAAQVAAVSVGEATAVTLVITRDCRGVDCGEGAAALACLGARCVEPSCTPEAPEACPPPECVAASDCAPPDPCADAVCSNGVCLYGDAGRCEATSYCDPELGCVSLGGPREAVPIVFSRTPDRADATPLEGAELSGVIYAFVADPNGLSEVDYRIDAIEDWRPVEVSEAPPFDLVSDSAPAAAHPLNVSLLPNGDHVMRVIERFEDGEVLDFEVPFRTTGALDGWFYGSDPYRTDLSPLEGATLTEPAYLVWAPGPRRGVSQVFFYLDDPSQAGPHLNMENAAPYDVVGTTRTTPFSAAALFDPATLSAAETHKITALLVLIDAASEDVDGVTFAVAP